MKVFIDKQSGFCFGVDHAIEVAERELKRNPVLYCLGEIVHNVHEVGRLQKLGLRIIDRAEFNSLNRATVLIRAHGEPPETYHTALKNQLELIDASCPIVLTLQQAVHQAASEMDKVNGQVVIYGKESHAEVVALVGQTDGKAIVVSNARDLGAIDFGRPLVLFSQTTKDIAGFEALKMAIAEQRGRQHGVSDAGFVWHDTICRQVSNRVDNMGKFAESVDTVIFVSSRNSSNGKALFHVCKEVNSETYLVDSPDELDFRWFAGVESVGVCGATSTPLWLMEQVKSRIELMAG